jgi:hypothetical protein
MLRTLFKSLLNVKERVEIPLPGATGIATVYNLQSATKTRMLEDVEGAPPLPRGDGVVCVAFRCDSFAAAGDLGYRGVRGAIGIGYRFTEYKRTLPPAPSKGLPGFIVNSKGLLKFKAKVLAVVLLMMEPS